MVEKLGDYILVVNNTFTFASDVNL